MAIIQPEANGRVSLWVGNLVCKGVLYKAGKQPVSAKSRALRSATIHIDWARVCRIESIIWIRYCVIPGIWPPKASWRSKTSTLSIALQNRRAVVLFIICFRTDDLQDIAMLSLKTRKRMGREIYRLDSDSIPTLSVLKQASLCMNKFSVSLSNKLKLQASTWYLVCSQKVEVPIAQLQSAPDFTTLCAQYIQTYVMLANVIKNCTWGTSTCVEDQLLMRINNRCAHHWPFLRQSLLEVWPSWPRPYAFIRCKIIALTFRSITALQADLAPMPMARVPKGQLAAPPAVSLAALPTPKNDLT